jgi:hypothetical protein
MSDELKRRIYEAQQAEARRQQRVQAQMREGY